jgi:hypothetical protein
MTYCPVGTLVTYTATISASLTKGYTSWATLSAQLSNDLRSQLSGLEELDVEASNGSSAGSSFSSFLSGSFTLSMQVLNNGVDHSDENDIKSIIDGTIQSYGNQIISSSITSVTTPNNPTVNTGAISNASPPTSPSSGGILSGLSLPSLSGGTIFGISTIIVIIAIVALVLLLPGNARRLVGA